MILGEIGTYFNPILLYFWDWKGILGKEMGKRESRSDVSIVESSLRSDWLALESVSLRYSLRSYTLRLVSLRVG